MYLNHRFGWLTECWALFQGYITLQFHLNFSHTEVKLTNFYMLAFFVNIDALRILHTSFGGVYITQTATLFGILSGDMLWYGSFFPSFLLLMMLVISASCFLNFSIASLTGFSVKCSSGYMPRYSCRGKDWKHVLKRGKASREMWNMSNLWCIPVAPEMCVCECESEWMINCPVGSETFHTSSSWYWLRAQTAPRCQLERPRSGRLSMIQFTFAKPFCLGGGFLMVDGALGIQENQSYCTM